MNLIMKRKFICQQAHRRRLKFLCNLFSINGKLNNNLAIASTNTIYLEYIYVIKKCELIYNKLTLIVDKMRLLKELS